MDQRASAVHPAVLGKLPRVLAAGAGVATALLLGAGPALADGQTTGQSNQNSQTTLVGDSAGVSFAGVGVAGPVVLDLVPQLGTNANGPINVNLLSNQDHSGNQGSVEQENENHQATVVQDSSGAAAALVGVAGPVVAPVVPQVGTNLNGPINVNLLSNQDHSGNQGSVEQENENHQATVVQDPSGAAAALVGVAGPVVAPVVPQVGTNLNGPINVNLLSNQDHSGNQGSVEQENENHQATVVQDPSGASTALIGVAGPVVAPVVPQVGTNVNCPINVNVLSNQDHSGNCGQGHEHHGPGPQGGGVQGGGGVQSSGGSQVTTTAAVVPSGAVMPGLPRSGLVGSAPSPGLVAALLSALAIVGGVSLLAARRTRAS